MRRGLNAMPQPLLRAKRLRAHLLRPLRVSLWNTAISHKRSDSDSVATHTFIFKTTAAFFAGMYITWPSCDSSPSISCCLFVRRLRYLMLMIWSWNLGYSYKSKHCDWSPESSLYHIKSWGRQNISYLKWNFSARRTKSIPFAFRYLVSHRPLENLYRAAWRRLVIYSSAKL